MSLQPERRGRIINNATPTNDTISEALAKIVSPNLTAMLAPVSVLPHPSTCCAHGVHVVTEVADNVHRCIWCGFTLKESAK